MSNYAHKPGQGTIFKNEKYIKGGNQPYAKGTIKGLDGKEYDVALWMPKSEKIKGFNLTMSEPYRKPEAKSSDFVNDETEEYGLPF